MKRAIIKASGTQMLISSGDIVFVDKIDEEKGKKVIFKEVLMTINKEKVKIGKPLVEKAKVTCQILSHVKDKKVRVQKYKPKKNYKRIIGHRQEYTQLKVLKIEG